jgi:hypothetical protein
MIKFRVMSRGTLTESPAAPELAAVVLIEAEQTLEEIRRSWSGEPRPSHAWEAEALDGIEADPSMLDDLAGGAEHRLEPLHSTSRVRCAMLARWLRRQAP